VGPSQSEPAGSGTAPAKVALRDQLLTARRRLPLAVRSSLATSLASVVVDVPEVRRAATIACYVAVGSEPGTAALLDALAASGRRVLLPVVLPSRDLDWAPYDGPASLTPAAFGLLEPSSPPLGLAAVATADVVLVPALAVSPRGDRLGRGGGSYDRALGRVPVGTFVSALVYDEEVGLDVPVEPHDRPVTAVASPSGITRFGPTF
jgi:5-formyltetrahydrofolate cyclo-ligase